MARTARQQATLELETLQAALAAVTGNIETLTALYSTSESERLADRIDELQDVARALHVDVAMAEMAVTNAGRRRQPSAETLALVAANID